MRKLGRKSNNRKSLIKNLVTSLIIYEHVETTLPKAKELKSHFDKFISDAKKDNLSNKRKAKSYLSHNNAYIKLYEEIIPRYKDIDSGFTSIYIMGTRVGDGGRKALVRLTKSIHNEDSKKKDVNKEKNDNKAVKENK